MKSINAILIICLITFATLSHGQYKINKTKYNAQMYSPHIGDPFNPVVAGITSYLIPGLGQVYSGETRRGLTFLGGAMGCLLVFVKGVDSAIQENTG